MILTQPGISIYLQFIFDFADVDFISTYKMLIRHICGGWNIEYHVYFSDEMSCRCLVSTSKMMVEEFLSNTRYSFHNTFDVFI